MGIPAWFGMVIIVGLTASALVFWIFGISLGAIICYIMFWRDSARGEKADFGKHNKRMTKRLKKQWEKQGREQPTRDYGQYNLPPSTINPPPLVPVASQQPKPRPGPSKPSGS